MGQKPIEGSNPSLSAIDFPVIYRPLSETAFRYCQRTASLRDSRALESLGSYALDRADDLDEWMQWTGLVTSRMRRLAFQRGCPRNVNQDGPNDVAGEAQAARGQYTRQLVIRSIGRRRLVDVARINRLEACGNYVEVRTASDSFQHRERLHVLQTQLDPSQQPRAVTSTRARCVDAGDKPSHNPRGKCLGVAFLLAGRINCAIDERHRQTMP